MQSPVFTNLFEIFGVLAQSIGLSALQLLKNQGRTFQAEDRLADKPLNYRTFHAVLVKTRFDHCRIHLVRLNRTFFCAVLVGLERMLTLHNGHKSGWNPGSKTPSGNLRLLLAALRTGFEFLRSRLHMPVFGKATTTQLTDWTSISTMPEEGLGLENALRLSQKQVLENAVRMDNPLYLGHMTSKLPLESHVSDLLISLMNQNVVKMETAKAATYIERQTLGWLHRLCFSESDSFYEHHLHHRHSCLGSVVSGGTLGNITGLLVARNRCLPDVAELGMAESLAASGYSRAVILASRRSHYSLEKTCSSLGMGSRSLETIPVEAQTNKIDLKRLAARIQKLRDENVLIVAMVGVAGSTETGSCDDLSGMAAIARREKIWLHVDAAWGGALLFHSSFREKLAGIEHADSVVVDGHKWLGLSLGHGAVLYRSPDYAHAISHTSRYIIRADSEDLGRFTLEGSRSFSAFGLWFMVMSQGRKTIAERLERSMQLAREFGELLQLDPDFEQTSAIETNIVTYRFFPFRWQQSLQESASRGQTGVVLNRFANRLNSELQKRQMEMGKSFVSRTSLESVGFQGEWITVLRAVLFNPDTKKTHLEQVLAEQRELAGEILFSGLDALDADEAKMIRPLLFS